jgi:hypothetical protein
MPRESGASNGLGEPDRKGENSRCGAARLAGGAAHTLLREHCLLIGLVAVYVAAGFAIEAFLGVPRRMKLQILPTPFLLVTAIFSLSFLLIQAAQGRGNQYLTPQGIGQFFTVLFLLAPFKSTFASIKQVIPEIHAFSWDQRLMELDYWMHFGHHPWELLRPLIYRDTMLRSIDLLYLLWFPMLFGFCVWMAWSRRSRLRLQYFLTTALVWIVLGSILGTVFSSAGPCYYAQVVQTGQNPYTPLMDYLSAQHESSSLWAVLNQGPLWQANLDHVWLPFGGVSAMPSVHVAMAVVFALVSWEIDRPLGIILALYSLSIQVGSVMLGWHYAVDGYAGSFLTVLLWKGVAKIICVLDLVPDGGEHRK